MEERHWTVSEAQGPGLYFDLVLFPPEVTDNGKLRFEDSGRCFTPQKKRGTTWIESNATTNHFTQHGWCTSTMVGPATVRFHLAKQSALYIIAH